MSIIVNEVARNVSSVNGFYRSEAFSLDCATIVTTSLSATTAKTWSPTFANAGNLRGVFLMVATAAANYTVPSRPVSVDLEETKGTVTFNTTTEKVLQNSHGLSDGDKVRFSSTGTLPTGITAGNAYYVLNKTANDYQLEIVQGSGTVVGLSGTPSGTATHWVTRATATKTAEELIGADQTYCSTAGYAMGYTFGTPYAVDTTASKWRFALYQGANITSNIQSWFMGINAAATIPMYVAWCDTAVSYSNTNDMIVSLDTLTIDQDYAPKNYTSLMPTSDNTTAYGVCGILATPVNTKRGWNTNCMLTVDGGNRTITIDGSYIISTQGGLYIGTEEDEIPDTQLVTVIYKNAPTIGKARYSCFAEWNHGLNYYGGGITICLSGTAPTKRFATLTADAELLQKDIVVDDATGFSIGDKGYISKHDTNYSSSSNATLYEIANIVGNTITMTANITGQRRLGPTTTTHGTIIAGAKFVKNHGYSIIMQSDSVASSLYATGFRTHSIVNLFSQGVQFRCLLGLSFYAIAYRFIENASRMRSAGMLVKYCLMENPGRTGGTGNGPFGNILPDSLPLYVEDNISCFQSIIGSLYKTVGTVAAGVTYKTGDMYFRRNLIMMSSLNSWSNGGQTNAKIIAEDNIAHGCSSGVSIGQTASESRRNVSYGCSVPMTINTSFNCLTEYNIIDRFSTGILFSAASISSGCISQFDEFTNPISYFMILLSDLLYNYTFQDCVGNLSNNDFTLQNNMVTGTKFRIVNNNETVNDDIVYTPNGEIKRCGVGLGDTTVHTAGGYSMRFKPIDSTTFLMWDQTIPTGNIQNKEMTVSCWVKINNLNYYTGVAKQLPRLHITYDNGTQVYCQASETTEWQLLYVTFTPLTTYGQVTMKVDGSTDALTTDKYFYLDDITVFYPAGVQLTLGNMDLWANALPITPTIATNVTASDIWAAQDKDYGSGTVGTKLNRLKNPSMLIDGEVII